jgi:hypothetical protein
MTTTDTALVTFSAEPRDEESMARGFTSLPHHMLQIPDTGNMAVAFSKHQRALPLPLAEVCDVLLHVPHHPTTGRCADPERGQLPTRPLLDDVACFSILLHHLTQSAGYNEHTFDGHKYDVAVDAIQTQQEDLAGKRRQERAQRCKEAQEGWDGNDHNGSGLWKYEQGDY